MASRLKRALPSSLRWRLTAWVAAVMLVSIAVLFVVVDHGTDSRLRGQIDRDIAGDTSQLTQLVSSLRTNSPARLARAVGRYIRAQPYRATSTLLFVAIPGQGTVSNHPEVFGVGVPERGETADDQLRENELGRRLRTAHLGYSTQPVADVGEVRLHERAVSIGARTVLVAAGEPLATVHSALAGLSGAFGLAAALTVAIALLASYLAGARVSAPLRRMAAVAARVDAGELAPRMRISPADGREVRVLAEAFNHMLERLAEAFAGQRAFIADASHELRTPITVIRGQLEVLAALERPTAADVRRAERAVGGEIARISRLIDDLLVLAQAERGDFLRIEPIDLRAFVGELWDGISLTARRRFELGPVPAGTLHADPDRLAQALRNLARNAIAHTREEDGLVRLEVERTASAGVRFVVLDDGPGIPARERERVFERFHRVDPGRSRRDGGAGLGLAIVRAIAQAHGGRVRALAARDGAGARIELELPGVRPTSAPLP